MNRSLHLKKTLIRNIEDNADYEDLEFVLLDYNSSDGLDSWIQAEMQSHLNSGKLIYFRTPLPLYFNRSHSRNMVFRVASGEILCNLDADNFTGKHFATYIASQFAGAPSIYLSPIKAGVKPDVYGRVCVKKSDFLAIKGFDEHMTNYGFEDFDFATRLELYGLRRIVIENNEYLTAIAHGKHLRLANENVTDNLECILVNYLTVSTTKLLYLFKDFSYRGATLVDNGLHKYDGLLSPLKQTQLRYPISLLEDGWERGKWQMDCCNIKLFHDGKESDLLSGTSSGNYYQSTGQPLGTGFYKLESEHQVDDAIIMFCEFENRLIMDMNRIEKRVVVNDNFGEGVLIKGFDSKIFY